MANVATMRLHRLLLRHPLGAVFPDDPLFAARDQGPVDGDNDTVFTTGYVAPLGTDPAYASLARYVFDVGDWEACRWIVFHGTSGDPASPHYDDQAGLWSRGEYHPMLWSRGQVEAHAEAKLVLAPDGLSFSEGE